MDISIIGGADGPTSICVYSPDLWLWLALLAAALALAIWFVRRHKK